MSTVISWRSIAGVGSWGVALMSLLWNSNLCPQRLKPPSICGAYGAAKAAPSKQNQDHTFSEAWERMV
jgi:hypothetical protein